MERYEREFLKACGKTDLKLLKEYKEKNTLPKEMRALVNGFREACSNGNLKIVKWLFKNSLIQVDELSYGIVEACESGNLELVKWFFDKLEITTVTYDKDDGFVEEYFETSCMSGNVEIPKWILATFPDIDVSFYDNLPFTSACISGSLEIAKWLLPQIKDIDVHKKNELICKALEYEETEVADWLKTL